MKYLLDTNVISEIRKSSPNPFVISRLQSIPPQQRYLSVITLGEVRRGIEKQQQLDPAYAARLEAWLKVLVEEYETRILPFDQKTADQWGKLPMTNPAHAVDLQIAAIAIIHKCTMVTRNVKHFTLPDLRVINLFEPPNA